MASDDGRRFRAPRQSWWNCRVRQTPVESARRAKDHDSEGLGQEQKFSLYSPTDRGRQENVAGGVWCRDACSPESDTVGTRRHGTPGLSRWARDGQECIRERGSCRLGRPSALCHETRLAPVRRWEVGCPQRVAHLLHCAAVAENEPVSTSDINATARRRRCRYGGGRDGRLCRVLDKPSKPTMR